MTLRNLRIFLAVADCGSMSEAAKKMKIAQPSVSGTIAEIEEHYGVRLFERLGRRLYITPIGTQLTDYARHILSLYDAMEQRLKNAEETDLLRVGATVTVGTCVLGDLLRKYTDSGNQAPHIVVDNTHGIEQRLLKSELDIGIVEGKLRSADLITQVMMIDQLVLLCAPDKNPFGTRRTVRVDELRDVPFILREEGSGTREVFENVMPHHVNIRWVCNNSEAILNGVQNGFGMTVTSRMLAADRLKKGQLTEITVLDADLTRPFSLAWHKNKYMGNAMKHLIDICMQYGKSG